ncbi:MAG: hypothetical protein ABI992_05950 [Chthoniobacterales bacterium]
MRIALRTNLDSAWQFHAPAEMSPRFEGYYRRAVERFSARPAGDTGKTPLIVPKLGSRVIINDREFADTAQMPPAYRLFYEEILAKALPLDRAIYLVARTEHANFIKRTISLLVIAAGVAAAIVYLWEHGYYA